MKSLFRKRSNSEITQSSTISPKVPTIIKKEVFSGLSRFSRKDARARTGSAVPTEINSNPSVEESNDSLPPVSLLKQRSEGALNDDPSDFTTACHEASDSMNERKKNDIDLASVNEADREAPSPSKTAASKRQSTPLLPKQSSVLPAKPPLVPLTKSSPPVQPTSLAPQQASLSQKPPPSQPSPPPQSSSTQQPTPSQESSSTQQTSSSRQPSSSPPQQPCSVPPSPPAAQPARLNIIVPITPAIPSTPATPATPVTVSPSVAIVTPPAASSLASEISNRARMRRIASGVVDQEFTIASDKRKLSGESPTKNTLEAGQIPLNISLPQRSLDSEDLLRKGSTTNGVQTRTSLTPSDGSSTTNAQRNFQRLTTQSVACPGFDSEAAESELRKALQLRKLRTLQQQG